MSESKKINQIPSTSKIPMAGAVYGFPVRNGFAYIQFCDINSVMGHRMRLIDYISKDKETEADKVAAFGTLYQFFYPPSLYLRKKVFWFLGGSPLRAEYISPPVFSLPSLPGSRNQPPKWELIYPDGHCEFRSTLSDEEMSFSLYQVLTPYGLVHHVDNCWTPSKENERYIAMQNEILRTGRPSALFGSGTVKLKTEFYLYFDKKEKADAARKMAQELGFCEAKVKKSEADANWLLTIKLNYESDESREKSMEKMSDLARDFEGEFDGWENFQEKT